MQLEHARAMQSILDSRAAAGDVASQASWIQCFWNQPRNSFPETEDSKLNFQRVVEILGRVCKFLRLNALLKLFQCRSRQDY